MVLAPKMTPQFIFEPFGIHFASKIDPLAHGLHLGLPGSFWLPFGSHLAPFGLPFGSLLDALGVLLGCSWALLGALGVLLVRSWGAPGGSVRAWRFLGVATILWGLINEESWTIRVDLGLMSVIAGECWLHFRPFHDRR